MKYGTRDSEQKILKMWLETHNASVLTNGGAFFNIFRALKAMWMQSAYKLEMWWSTWKMEKCSETLQPFNMWHLANW